MARCKNNYSLPVKKKDIIDYSYHWSDAHFYPYNHSVDFICEEGVKIYAAAAGTVVWLQDKYNDYGDDKKKYWDKGNRVVLKHKNREFTAYEHLACKGIIVKVGQKVKKGQFIGYNGNTGYSPFPHLHFEVFNNPVKDQSEGITLQVSFKELR